MCWGRSQKAEEIEKAKKKKGGGLLIKYGPWDKGMSSRTEMKKSV